MSESLWNGKLDEIKLDDVLDALRHVQRRKLLMALMEHNPQDDSPVVITDSDTDEKAMKRLVEMKHSHLPKLEEYGLIEWNQADNEVVKGANFHEIRPLLKLLDQHEDELPKNWL